MKIKVKVLAGFSLGILSLAAFAGTATFSLQNDNKSLQDPLVITAGSITYQTTTGCSGQVPYNLAGTDLDKTKQTPILIDTSIVPTGCWKSNTTAVFQLILDSVDNKKSLSPSCTSLLTVHSADENATQQNPLYVYEMGAPNDGFVCSLAP